MATKLKVVETNEGARLSAPEGVVADTVPAPEPPSFDLAPTRNKHSGWTAERQRRFIEHLGRLARAYMRARLGPLRLLRFSLSTGAQASAGHAKHECRARLRLRPIRR